MKPIKKEVEQSEYSTFGRNEFRNHHTGEMQKSVTIDWSPLNHISMIDTKIPEEEVIWHKYLKNFPDFVVLDQLHIDDFGDCIDLARIYHQKAIMCPKAKLASLPIATLDKLLKLFK